MVKAYFVNEKTGRRFEILSFDQENRTVTMRGTHSEIVEPYDKERFKAMGYKLVKEEVDEEDVDEDD